MLSLQEDFPIMYKEKIVSQIQDGRINEFSKKRVVPFLGGERVFKSQISRPRSLRIASIRS